MPGEAVDRFGDALGRMRLRRDINLCGLRAFVVRFHGFEAECAGACSSPSRPRMSWSTAEKSLAP